MICSSVKIRWIIKSDLPELAQVEARAKANPWPLANFNLLFKQRDVVCLVAEDHSNENDPIVGHMVYEYSPNRTKILNIVVDPLVQRRGIGMALLFNVKDQRHKTQMIIRETSTPALNMFKKAGFKATRIRRGFFGDTHEDGILMSYRSAVIA